MDGSIGAGRWTWPLEKRKNKQIKVRSGEIPPEESFDWDILAVLFQLREVEPRGGFVIAFPVLVLSQGEVRPVINSLRWIGWLRALLINLQGPQILLVRH